MDGADGTPRPSEFLDCDEVRNDDGDIAVDALLRWISSEDNLMLDKRLAADEPRAALDFRSPPSL